jgi:hypothetical protein
MPIRPILIFMLLVCLIFPGAPAAAADADHAEILAAAESIFQHMEKRNYPALWEGLSEATRRSIARSVGKAIARAGGEAAEEGIRADFATGGPIARQYWEAYLAQFDPRTVLEESRWSMGAVKRDRAEIVLRYRKSRHDTILKLVREGGAWHVGLDETFSTRQ